MSIYFPYTSEEYPLNSAYSANTFALCGPNVIRKHTTLRGPNVIRKHTTLCGPNVIRKHTT